jgi:polysaccharide export outer membrane protein
VAPFTASLSRLATIIALGLGLIGCAATNLPPAPSPSTTPTAPTQNYVIGPGDSVEIFVWRNPDLSRQVPVRPDGRISIPLIDDQQAAGKTATELGNEIEKLLSEFVQDPRVTVIVSQFVGPFGAQIRFVGDGVAAQAIPYRENMSLLDAIITIGGLKEFASGNNARISRGAGADATEFRVRMDDLLNKGDLTANVDMQPGDIVIVPESWF